MKMRVDLKKGYFKPFLISLICFIMLISFIVIFKYYRVYNHVLLNQVLSYPIESLVLIPFFLLLYYSWRLYKYFSLSIGKFMQFIVLNNLYKRFPDNVQEVVNSGSSMLNKNKSVITYQVTCIVEKIKKKNELKVSFLLDGSSYAEKTKDVQNALSDMLNLTLKDIKYESKRNKSYISYIYYRDESKRIFLDTFEDIEMYKPIDLNNNYAWDFSKSPNGLVIGGISSGKTYFLIYLILQFKMRNAIIKILDPKNTDLVYVGEKLNIDVSVSTGAIAKELRIAVEEMEKRSEIFKEKGIKLGEDYRYYELQPYVIFFDEVSASIILAEKKEREEIQRYYQQIVLKGRQLGVFLILATQRPDASKISGDVRDNLSLRVALGALSQDGYRMCFDNEIAKTLHKLEQSESWLFIDGMGWLNAHYLETPTLKLDLNDFESREVIDCE